MVLIPNFYNLLLNIMAEDEPQEVKIEPDDP